MSDEVNPDFKVKTIGKGSFAAVKIFEGRPMAFKEVLNHTEIEKLHAEYLMLKDIYQKCNTDSFFRFARPLAYFCPQGSHFEVEMKTPPSSPSKRPARPAMAENDFEELKITTAAYAMDLVQPLPPALAKSIRQQFYPPGVPETAPNPSLCRIYFGKEIAASGRPQKFFNSANFQLDVARYTKLHTEDVAAAEKNKHYLPTVQEIAHGMGQMLGRIHFKGGYTGQDIEFVIGSEGFSDVALFVIDFNQMKKWDKKADEVPELVRVHFLNDPYFPYARESNPLFKQFEEGYLSVPEANNAVGKEFLAELIKKQTEKDAAAGK